MVEQKLSNVYAVVTGGSSGLGLAMGTALLRQGAKVALASRPGDRLEHAVEALRSEGLDAVALPLDVRSEQSAADAASWVKQHWGRLDLLVNNAGVGERTVNPEFMTRAMPFFEVSPAAFRDVVDTNLTGYFLVSRAFVPLMIAQKKGRIVNTGVNRDTMRRAGFVPYGPSRAGSASLSLIMAEDLRPYGIMVNVLLPGGAADTGMITDEYRREKGTGSLLSAEVMAAPIVFLASPEAEGITGESITAAQFEDWLKQKGLRH
jgi:gluconate 5-dehydrogenase